MEGAEGSPWQVRGLIPTRFMLEPGTIGQVRRRQMRRKQNGKREEGGGRREEGGGGGGEGRVRACMNLF